MRAEQPEDVLFHAEIERHNLVLFLGFVFMVL